MRTVALAAIALAVALCGACGASPPPPPVDPAQGRAIGVEWRAEQGEGDLVNVTLVVDDKPLAIGSLEARSEDAIGPYACALRAAHPLRTELVCGSGNYYAAELAGEELVISRVAAEGEKPVEVKRVPVIGEGLAVRPYRL